MHGGDTLNLKKASTLLHELLKGGRSKNAAVQESVDSYKRLSRPGPTGVCYSLSLRHPTIDALSVSARNRKSPGR